MNAKVVVFSMALIAAACEQTPPNANASGEMGTLPVSTNELMVSLIDQAAQRLWATGEETTQSHHDWTLAEFDAINLIAAGALINQTGAEPRDAEWAEDQDWRGWSSRMQAAAMAARVAAENRDAEQLTIAGQALQQTCSGCHTAFMPAAPTGDLYAAPLELSDASSD